MQLSLLTKTQIVNLQVAAVQGAAAAGGFTINCSDGSIVLAVINATALVYLWLQWMAVQILAVSRLATSTGTDCDTFGADFEFERLPGVASSGVVTFARYTATNAATVPVGATLKTTDGTQSFVVVADATQSAYSSAGYAYIIPAGVSSITATVQNMTVGIGGNVIAGAIGLISTQILFVDTVTNAATFTNGINAESDTAFKARFSLYLPALAKATPIALESATIGVSQNLTCAVLTCTATVGGSFAPGYGVIAVDDGSGTTPSATLNAVSAAAAGSSIVALGAIVTVVQAPVVYAAVELSIVCASATLKAAALPIVQSAITSYIGALPVSSVPGAGEPANGVLSYNILAKIAFDASPSVLNISALTLNGSTADIGGSPGTVVRVLSVTVN